MPNPSSSATPTTGATVSSGATSPSGAGQRPTVSIILHGHRWPAASAVATLRARLLDALPGAEIIETREDPASAIGAAALMSAAAARATGGILVFLEPSLVPKVEDLRTLAAAAADSQCLALARGWAPVLNGEPTAETSAATDLLSRLAADVARHAALPLTPSLSPQAGRGGSSPVPLKGRGQGEGSQLSGRRTST
jgi:hypothetical protein